jgi:coatomer subunit beta'
MFIRVYNYNTLERLHQFEAHSDYIRSLAIHPTQSYILTSSGMYDGKSIDHSDY